MLTRMLASIVLALALTQTSVVAGTFHDFQRTVTPPDGGTPIPPLINVNGVFYGTTTTGGTYNFGTVFRINGTTVTTLYSFQGAPNDGASPEGQLLMIGNVLYGTTEGGGAFSRGTIFSFPINGSSDQILHSFYATPTDGFFPLGSLVNIGTDLYGTTANGGTGTGCTNVSQFVSCGTVYRQSICSCGGTGSYATLYSFKGLAFGDGGIPYGGLTYWHETSPARDWLYGTTYAGGQNTPDCPFAPLHPGCGTVFRILTSGANETVLHLFAGGADGFSPYDTGGLLIVGNSLYGTTYYGGLAGSQNNGTVFTQKLNGANYHVIYSFNLSDGQYPLGTPIEHYDTVSTTDWLYGTTLAGGQTTSCTYPTGCGVLFRMKLDGSSESAIHFFAGQSVTPADGGHPYSGVVFWADPNASSLNQANEWLYGTTQEGGASNNCQYVVGCGTAYRFHP